jgi:hypothetical protein
MQVYEDVAKLNWNHAKMKDCNVQKARKINEGLV